MARRNGLICILWAGPIITVRDANGKRWRFEWHDYHGPTVVDRKGEPTWPPPPEGSAFWAAFKKWHAKQPRKPAPPDLPQLGIKKDGH